MSPWARLQEREPAGWVPVWYWHTRVRHMGTCATHGTHVNLEDLTFMNLDEAASHDDTSVFLDDFSGSVLDGTPRECFPRQQKGSRAPRLWFLPNWVNYAQQSFLGECRFSHNNPYLANSIYENGLLWNHEHRAPLHTKDLSNAAWE